MVWVKTNDCAPIMGTSKNVLLRQVFVPISLKLIVTAAFLLHIMNFFVLPGPPLLRRLQSFDDSLGLSVFSRARPFSNAFPKGESAKSVEVYHELQTSKTLKYPRAVSPA